MSEPTHDRPAACRRRSLACVYCGQRTDEHDPGPWRRVPAWVRELACWRHRSLVAADPEYAR